MEIFDITQKYQNKKLYNMIEVIDKFKEYFNMSLEELELYFNNYLVIEKEKVLDYINSQGSECAYLEEVVNNRMLEYDYYHKVLDILSTKALKCLELVKYLCDCNKKNNFYEELLEEAQIYHYSSIVVGEDVNKILIVIFHLLKKFNNILAVINDKESFQVQGMSMGILNNINEELYPNEELVVVGGYYIDKTSFNVKKKRQ